MPRIEGFDEIEEKIRRHPGAIAYYNIIDLQRVFRGIYKENRNQLVQHIVAVSSDSISIELIQNVRPSDFKEQYTTELLRRLFIYLSSLSSLVELEMRLSKKYAAHNLMLYNEISVDIIQSGENAFLGNLRNYILHYGIPLSDGV